MRITTALIIIPFCVFLNHAWCHKGHPERKTVSSHGDTIRVMSYNVENLFDLAKDGGEYPEYVPGQQNWNRGTHAIKIKNVASVIAAARPSIAVLCEIENLNALGQLQKAITKQGWHLEYRAIADRPQRTNTCPAILSCYPIVRENFLTGPLLNGGYSRNTLEADIAIGHDTLKVFAVHWPSKHNADSTRLISARLLAERIRHIPRSTDYLIAGDFNTDYNEAPLGHGLGTFTSRPGSPVAFVAESDLRAGVSGLIHYDCWLELPAALRGSYVYKRTWCTLDHFLLPPALYDSCGLSYRDNSFSVFTWGGRLLDKGVPFRWALYQRKGKRFHMGQGYSDHLPIIIDIVRFTPTAFTMAKQ